MKTKFKYIEFAKFKYIEFVKVGDQWICRNHKYDDIIGVVEYLAHCRRWEFVSGDGTSYTADCLRDIAIFLDGLHK